MNCTLKKKKVFIQKKTWLWLCEGNVGEKAQKATQNKFYSEFQSAQSRLCYVPAWEDFWYCQRLYAGKWASELLDEKLCQAVSESSNRSPKKKSDCQWINEKLLGGETNKQNQTIKRIIWLQHCTQKRIFLYPNRVRSEYKQK